MRDHFTGIDFSDPFMNYAPDVAPKPTPYRMLRAQHRHLYDWPQGQYRPASTHAEALEKFGFRVTSGGGR